jgi:hypothetical protein
MHGLDGGWKDVFYEFACLPREMLVGHKFIVSKGVLVPACLRLYNQGNICAERCRFLPVPSVRNRWPCTCITVVGNWVAPNERGRTWKYVSKA